MLTIQTSIGSVQFHRYEYVRIRKPGEKSENKQVKDWLWESRDCVGIKINPGDEIRVNGEWLTVQAVSWNAAYDREQETERASLKDRELAEELLRHGLVIFSR